MCAWKFDIPSVVEGVGRFGVCSGWGIQPFLDGASRGLLVAFTGVEVTHREAVSRAAHESANQRVDVSAGRARIGPRTRRPLLANAGPIETRETAVALRSGIFPQLNVNLVRSTSIILRMKSTAFDIFFDPIS